jgi:hypothetical protein
MTFDEVFDWLRVEREYQQGKWDYAEEARTGKTAEHWEERIDMYLRRAAVLGYDTPLGRQAMLKAVATAIAMAEAVTEAYGPPPPPGVPSGEDR